MKAWVGTSGYAYKEWKGPFYPEKIKADAMLPFYGERLPSVEINNTFYRLPKAAVLEKWSSAVPEDFRFVLKASQRITHHRRLKAEAAEPLEYLLKTAAVLGPRLGPFLFQLPPNFKANLERLEAFLKLLPPGTRAAFEFRNETWEQDETHGLLEAAGVARCIADDGGGEEGEVPEDPAVIRTAPYGYLRLRRSSYDDDALKRWAARIAEQGWDEVFVFFKHEDEGAGPRMARRFLDLLEG